MSSTTSGSPSGSGVVGVEHDRRPGVGDHVLDLGVGEPRVDRHDDAAGHQRAPEPEAPLEAVAVPVGHPVAALQTGGGEPAGHPRRSVPHLAVRDPLAAEDHDALAVGRPLDGVAEHVEQRLRESRVPQHAIVGALDAGHVERHDGRRSPLLGDHAEPPSIRYGTTSVPDDANRTRSPSAAARDSTFTSYPEELRWPDACAEGRQIAWRRACDRQGDGPSRERHATARPRR